MYTAKNIRLDLTADKRRRLLDAYLTLAAFPDVRPGLESLRRSGVRLAILSNGEPKMLNAAAKSAGITDLFHIIVSAEEVSGVQAEPEGLLAHLRADESRARQCGVCLGELVGHRRRGSAGLQTFWVRRSADPPEELGFPPTHIVKAITDLPAIISPQPGE